jgi:hypothetical protein
MPFRISAKVFFVCIPFLWGCFEYGRVLAIEDRLNAVISQFARLTAEDRTGEVAAMMDTVEGREQLQIAIRHALGVSPEDNVVVSVSALDDSSRQTIVRISQRVDPLLPIEAKGLFARAERQVVIR